MKLDIGRVFSSTIELVQNNLLIFVPQLVASLITFIMTLVLAVGFAGGLTISDGNVSGTEVGVAIGSLLLFIAVMVVVGFIAYGIQTGMACDVVETGTTSIGSGLNRFFSRLGPIIIAGILSGLIVIVGAILCIIPGIIAGFFLMFTIVGIVYSRLGAVESMSNSYNVVKSNISDSIILLAIIIGLGIGGGIASSILGIVPVIGALAGLVVQGILNTFTAVLLVNGYAGLTTPEPMPEPVV